MLYISTRNKAESFTAYRVLHGASASNGAQIVPFQMKPLEEEKLHSILHSDFHSAVAEILNMFFPVNLNPWDVELCVGRNAVKCVFSGHKLVIAETWRNPLGSYLYIENALYSKMTGRNVPVPYLVSVAIRTAVLFGVYTQIRKNPVAQFDFSANAGDGSTFLAAYFARFLGLPIGKIIVGCDDSSGLWDLMQKGEIPFCANAASTMEALIYCGLGSDEAARYLQTASNSRTYLLDKEQFSILCDGFFAAVVGTQRADGIVGSFWKSNQYVITPDTALSYSALQDYRAKTGESRDTLLFSDGSPLRDAGRIQNMTGLTYDQLAKEISAAKE